MLICMQKINLITHFFLKILQRNRKRVSLDNLGMPGHIHLNWYQFKEAYGIHLKAKKQFHLSCFLWDIADIANLLSWVLWACLTMHTQNYTINLQKTFVYLQTKNQLHPTCFSGNIPKICKLLVLGTLGMPGYTHPVSSGRNVCCLPACLKWPSLFTSFLRYDILKNPAKLYWPTVFCHTILSHNSRTRILQYMVGGEISISK